MVITYGMGFIGKTFLVPLWKSPLSILWVEMVASFRRLIVVIVERLFAMFFTVFIDFARSSLHNVWSVFGTIFWLFSLYWHWL